MEKIVIVESPAKSKTISTYLGNGYKVLSSVGHVCDLATTGAGGLGIDIEHGFIPNYKINKDKEAVVSQLKKECKGKMVYLASDPDREGEAIAYHLARILELDMNELNRVKFNAITKEQVKKALDNPERIDLNKVNSQETRRMIDRILGFKLSKLLQKKIASKSAGRVQSAVLLLIVNLEREITSFVQTPYYEMEAEFNTFKLKLTHINDEQITDKNRITDRSILENLQTRLSSFVVSNISEKQVKRASAPTYITSTMLQDAASKLGFNSTKTMKLAQSLYEGKNVGSETVGLITYMRTDSTRLDEGFVQKASEYILTEYGSKYLGGLKVKNQKGIQDAHEAIRPTSITRTPQSVKQYLTNDEYKLYRMIYNRCIASLMTDAIYKSTNIEFSNTDSTWGLHGSSLVFDGYQKAYGKEEDNDLIPSFTLGDSYNANDITIIDKMTQPKSRYTEDSLIGDMKKLEIGRPSTYAQTIKTLQERDYIRYEKNSIVPTSQGILTTENLEQFFADIINIEYTANMERALDEIGEGTVDKLEELNKFYNEFMPLFEKATENMDNKYPIPTDEICPVCNNILVIRKGKFGEFVSCSNYPHCNYIKKEENQTEDTGVLCPVCGKHNLQKRVSTAAKNKGQVFYSCGGYPKCKTIYNDLPTNNVCPDCGAMMLEGENGLYCSNKCQEKKNQIKCPNCADGFVVLKTAARGKNKGKNFYACNNYPKCRTMFVDTPTKDTCPKCGSMMMLKEDGSTYCSKYCEATSSISSESIVEKPKAVSTDIICPKCGKGHLVKRVAAKGKNSGNEFFACDKFPRCKNIVTVEEYNKLITK